MQPKSISLMGFKCFQNQTLFKFPTEAGLYWITGRNDVHPALEGNGCGKSTLFADALTWVLFGKTPRLLKANDVIHWEAASSSVDFCFEHRNESVRVLRTQSPNSLSWAKSNEPLQTISQDQLTDFLDIDFDSFTSSVVFGQFTSMFFDLSPADKSSLLSNILNLDVWDSASQCAKKRSDQLQISLNTAKQELSKVEGQILALSNMNFTDKINDWILKQTEQSELLEDEKIKLDKELKNIMVEGAKCQKQNVELKESLTSVVEIKSEILEEIAAFDKEINQHSYKVSGLTSQLEMAKKELNKFEKVSGECPYCLQAVDEDHLRKEKQRIQKSITKVLNELSTVKDLIQAVVELKESSKDNLLEAQAAEREIKQDYDEVTKKINAFKVAVMGIQKDLSSVKTRLDTLKTAKNPYLYEEEQVLKKISNFSTIVKELNGTIGAIEQEELNASFWIKGFKDVRLMLISDVLTQLELEVNNHLFSLGLQDWKINFAVDGLTKGGKIKKGFVVTISTPQNLEPVPWAAWSGGETQRLRLAGALGMTDLILSKSTCCPTLEVLDEPSQYMSNQGIVSLIQVLQDRARRLNKTIFLIDHRHLEATSFDGQYTVIKNSDGVFIE